MASMGRRALPGLAVAAALLLPAAATASLRHQVGSSFALAPEEDLRLASWAEPDLPAGVVAELRAGREAAAARLAELTSGLRGGVDRLTRAGWKGQVALVLAFSAWVCASLPVTPVEVAAGFLYGPLWGSAAGLCCKVLGSCASFLAARRCRRRLRCAACRVASGRKTSSALRKRPVLTMIGIRLTPVPLGVKNYGLGLSEAPFGAFLLSVLLVDAPFSVLWASTGASCHSLADALSLDESRALGPQERWWCRALPAALVLALLVYLVGAVMCCRRRGTDVERAASQPT